MQTYELRRFSLLLLIMGGIISFAFGQTAFYLSRDFQSAVKKGTRTLAGLPGPGYWQNRGLYVMDVTVSPHNGQVTGQATIQYTNHSPDILPRLNLKLFQNVHRPRTFRADWADDDFLTDGLFIDRIQASGQDIKWNNEAVHRSPDPTNAWIMIPKPLLPGESIELSISWHYVLQRSVANHREGMVDSTALFCAYWYPRIAVYDDLNGWDLIPMNNQVEFYNDYNDYEVTVRVPENFIVWATGELQNAPEVLNQTFLDRLDLSRTTDRIVPIVTNQDLKKGGITRRGGQLAWRFKAQNVTDFAFGVSNHFRWDATSLVVDSIAGRRASVQTAYSSSSTDFPEVAQIARECLHYFSVRQPGIPYPYPTLSIFNGHGQMEYPMMVNDNEMFSLDDTKALTAHEIAHTYFPFLVGTNESAFAWMDEGWATFFEYFACTELYTLAHPEQAIYPGYYLRRYLASSSAETETPIFTLSYQLIGDSYLLNAYGKAAAAYLSLRYLLGPAEFQRCLQTYADRWRSKHPSPYDFFLAFSDVSGQDLTWFWNRWFMTYNTMDLALTGYRQDGETLYVSVRNIGGKPLPITLEIAATGNPSRRFHFSPALWKMQEEVEVSIGGAGVVQEIRLVWEDFVDVNGSNDRLAVQK